MANFILSPDFFDYTILSQSSEDLSYPASNLKIYAKQNRWWKTTVATDSEVVLDFGAPLNVKGVGVINPNYASCKIQFNSTSSFTSPAVDSGTLTVRKDEERKRYYLFHAPVANYRYMRLFIPAQTPVDGDSVFSTGALVVLTGTPELLLGPGQNVSVTVTRASIKNDLLGGGREVTNTGERRAILRLSFDRDVRVEAEADELAQKIMSIDETTHVLIADVGNFLSKGANSPFVYVATRDGDATKQLSNYSLMEVNDVIFREEI